MKAIAIAAVLLAVGAFSWAERADAAPADCRVYTASPNFVVGTAQTLPCTPDGLRVVNGSPGTDQDVNIVGVGGNAVTTSVPVAGTGAAGTAATGVVTVQGIASMTPVVVSDGTGALNVIVDSGAIGLSAPTTGGCTPGKTLSASSTNSTSVKGSAGTLCSLTVINTTATLYYLKFYDKATAPTCNSDTVIQSIPVPASASGAGVAVDVGPYGWAFTLGIGFCLTGALADNDNTNAATGLAISYSYK